MPFVQPQAEHVEPLRGQGDAGSPADDDAAARSEKMRALARRRWDKEREEAARLQVASDLGRDSDRVGLVRVPLRIGNVMRQLEKDALAGDSGAARELRAWLSQFPPDQDAANASDLDTVTRTALAKLLARGLAELEQSLHTDSFEAGTQGANDSSLDAESEPAEATPAASGSHTAEEGEGPT